MLSTLRIQNIALIPSVEINFGSKFNVLTGETGAGKSIIIGSLNFIFGDKLSANSIRSGTDFAKVTAVFDDTIITRTLKADGKSDIRVNDEPVTLKALREIAGALIDIHGQHDTEKLLVPKNHIHILDSYGKTDLSTYKTEYEKLQNLEKQLMSFGDNESERERLIDLYDYQIKEIQNAKLSPNEEEDLNAKVIILRNAEKMQEGLSAVLSNLEAADIELSRGVKKILPLTQYDEKLNTLSNRLDSVSSELVDILTELRDYVDQANLGEGNIENLYDRLDEIKTLKRKYGNTVQDISAFLEKAKVEYDRLLNASDVIDKLNRQIKEQTEVVITKAKELTQIRKDAATNLQSRLAQHLFDLGMPNAKFEVVFYNVNPKLNGADEVEFFFSANIGEQVKPLSQIISGGEMSRLMLAIKTVANTEQGKTLVFDEIDTGISGIMGGAVASKLSALSQTSQIIVVTHLASIAASADTHFLIEKNVSENKTVTNVYPLNKQARVEEVARIIGGGQTAVAHAEALLSGK